MPTLMPNAFQPVVAAAYVHSAGGTQPADRIAGVVELLLAAPLESRRGSERRREHRHPFPYPIHLMPLDAAGSAVVADAVIVLGKHLSSHGLDFYHHKPLACRRAIVSMPGPTSSWLGLLMDLTWCRFGEHGWYDNGGRFLAVADSPLNADQVLR